MYTTDNIVKKITGIYGKYDNYTVLSDWFKIMALTIRNSIDVIENEEHKKREQQYLDTIKKYKKEEVDVFVECFGMLAEICQNCQENGFYDWLGDIYMKSGTQSKQNAQCFTPYHLGKMLARMDLQNISKEEVEASDRIITCYDPAVGGGCLPIGFCEALHNKGINYCKHAFIVCGDIDYRCFYMTYVQLSLIGAAGVVMRQNALTLETWEVWDTPMYAMHYLRFRNCLKKKDTQEVKSTETPLETTDTTPQNKPQKSTNEYQQLGQMSLFDIKL